MTDPQPNDVPDMPDANPAPTGTPNPALIEGQPGEYWLKSYKGSQSALRQKQNDLSKALTDLNSLQTEHQTKKAELETQAEALRRERDLLVQEKAVYEARLKSFERRDSLRSMISGVDAEGKPSKYRDLTPAFDSGVLVIKDDLDGENLTAFLDNALNFFKGVQSVSVTSVINGAAPSAPAGGQPPGMTLEQMNQKLNELLRAGKDNTDEYRALRAQWQQALRDNLKKS